MMYARMDGSVVAELLEDVVDGFGIAERYHPDIVAALIEAPDDVEPGWVWDGTVFAPPPEPVPPALTEADYQRAIEAHVDAVAQGRRYSSAAACASYVASTVPSWAAEAAAFVAWRDQAYLEAFELLAAVTAGQAEPPTIEAFIAGLTALEWPEAAAL